METDELLGSNIGRYHIISYLGEGGMAVVYQAFDPRLDRKVAVKVLKLNQLSGLSSSIAAQTFLKRFEHEAHALAQLQHPNIVPIIDFGSAGERYPYLVMPLLSGGTLVGKTGQANPVKETARLLAPIAEALAYAHHTGIIHRDIKPSNILLTQSGDPMLADFGIARFLEKESMALTASGAFIGTPGYMAPEQWNGQVLPQTDIFALSIVFYELVTGHNPYSADTPQQVMYKQLMEPLPSPRQFIANLPFAVEETLLRGLAREPANRYPDMENFAVILRQFAAGNIVPSQTASKGVVTSVDDRTAIDALPQVPTALEQPGWSAPAFADLQSDGAFREKGPPSFPDVRPSAGRRSRWLAWGVGSVIILGLFGIFVIGLILSNRRVQPVVTNLTPVAKINSIPVTTAFTPSAATVTIPTASVTTFALIPTQTTVLPTLTHIAANINVLWDCSHGPEESHDGGKYDLNGLYSGISGLLTGNGFQIHCNEQDLAMVDLSSYGAVVLAEWSAASRSYDEGDADRIESYVKQGGNLLVLADNPDSKKHVGAVAERFGVSVANKPPLSTISNFSGHTITQGINSIMFYFLGGTLETANSSQVVARSGGHPAVIAIENLPGRVVIIGDANLFDNRGLEYSDNKLFAVNLFRWLTR